MLSETAIDRVSRLITLIPFLSRHETSLTEISHITKISKDTIARDLEIVFMCGLPGYTPDLLIDLRLDGDSIFIRDPQSLDLPEHIESEVLIFSLLGLHFLASIVPQGSKQLGTIEALLNKLEKHNLMPISFGSNEWNSMLTLIRDAIDSKHLLKFDYIDIKGKKSFARLAQPSEILWRNGQTILKALDVDLNEYRHFFLHQMSELSILSSQMQLKPIPKESNSAPEVIRLTIPAGQGWWLKLMRPMISSLEILNDGDLEIKLMYWNEDWLVRALAGLYGLCKIAGPEKGRLEGRLREYLMELVTTR